MIDPDLRNELLAALPSLRAFALSLTGNGDRADDLVQDTIVRAWGNLHRFQDGTNLQAWLFTILRNHFYSEHRKRQREVEDVDGLYAASLISIPDQNARLDLQDFQRALMQLPLDQREALLLVGASGFSYEQAAEICGCAVGTIKSRVNRARNRLAELMHFTDMEEDLGPDRVTLSVMHALA
jgi:RNA polymerase sigma-70 factor (ECF subfamily)